MFTCRQSATSCGSGRRWTIGLLTFPAGFLLMGEVSVPAWQQNKKEIKEISRNLSAHQIYSFTVKQLTHCYRWFPVCHSPPRSHRRPSTERRWSWGSGNSCQSCFGLPSGHLCRCHMCCRRWQSSSRAERRRGPAACPGGFK